MTVHKLSDERLRRTRPHEVVEAAEIVSVNLIGKKVLILNRTGEHIELDVREGFFTRSIPSPGDYLIRYKDGYISHTPAVLPVNGRLMRSSIAVSRRPA